MHNLTVYATEQPFSGSGVKNFTHPVAIVLLQRGFKTFYHFNGILNLFLLKFLSSISVILIVYLQ